MKWHLAPPATLGTTADFNLTAAEVLDEGHPDMLGVVTADDVIGLLLPTGWRGNSGKPRAEE